MTKSLIKKAKKSSPFKALPESKDGKLSKERQTFLQIVKENFGFEPAREFINMYTNEQELYQDLHHKMKDEKRRAKMTDEEKGLFWRLHTEIKESLKTVMRYSYPSLKSAEIKGSGGPAPVFNINLGFADKPMKSANPVIDVTPEDED